MPLNEQSALYQQIAKMLEDGVLRGIYREEEQVPSTNELVEQGILYKRRGIGMFVSPGAVQAITAKRRAAFYEQFILPLVAEASSLGLTGTELAAMLEQAAQTREETT